MLKFSRKEERKKAEETSRKGGEGNDIKKGDRRKGEKEEEKGKGLQWGGIMGKKKAMC